MIKEINIIGSGGHSRSLINLLEINNFKIFGIYDDSYNVEIEDSVNNYKIRGKIASIPKDKKVVIALGDIIKRKELYDKYSKLIYNGNVIHPTTIIEKNVNIGVSNQIFAKAYINFGVKIGNNNILNTGIVIEHECVIGNHNHISVGAILCGRVRVGNSCFIGAGSVLIDKIKIKNNITIGANSVVINDILEPGVYVGNPIRKIS